MQLKITLIYTIFLLLFVSCSDNQSDDYINGRIQSFQQKDVTIKNAQSKPVVLNGNQTGIIAAYDSLLICWNPGYVDYFFNVFNVDTGKDLGFFCRKGRGRNEALSLNCIYQLFKKGDDLMSLLYASNEGKLFLWNITQSIKSNATVYDTIIPYNNDRILFHFYQSQDVMLAYKPSEESSIVEGTTPFYEKRTIYSNELLNQYPIYKLKSVQNNNAKSSVGFFFYTWDAIKPDGSKIVQVMRHLAQINIIDANTGEVVACRMKDGPDFSLLQTDMEAMNIYYNSVHTDDNYIYAGYWGKQPWVDRAGSEMPIFNTIHVFDWDGKLCYEIVTDKSFFRLWSDPVRNRLYTINMNNDEVYYIDLNELNLD